MIFCADFGRDFDRGELLVFGTHNADPGHIADVYTTQPHGGADSQTLGIVEVAFDGNTTRKQPGGPGHQEEQQPQRTTGNDDGDSDAQFGPLELLLARQIVPS